MLCMAPTKRFSGVVNFYIPDTIRSGIERRVAKTGETQSEVMRNLLEIGLEVLETREQEHS